VRPAPRDRKSFACLLREFDGREFPLQSQKMQGDDSQTLQTAMENVSNPTLFEWANKHRYCRGIPRGSGPLQSPSLISLRRVAAKIREASDDFRALLVGNHASLHQYEAAAERVGTSAGRRPPTGNCRGHRTGWAHLQALGVDTCAIAGIFSDSWPYPTACRRLRPSSGSRRELLWTSVCPEEHKPTNGLDCRASKG